MSTFQRGGKRGNCVSDRIPKKKENKGTSLFPEKWKKKGAFAVGSREGKEGGRLRSMRSGGKDTVGEGENLIVGKEGGKSVVLPLGGERELSLKAWKEKAILEEGFKRIVQYL